MKAPSTFSSHWTFIYEAIGHGVGRRPTTSVGHLVKSHGPSPSAAICLFSSPLSLQPFYRLLSCWVALVRASLFAQETGGKELECKLNCQQVCVEVKSIVWKCVCSNVCVSTLLCFCTVVVTVEGWFHSLLSFRPMTGEQNHVWQTTLLRMEQKCSEPS